MSTGSECQFLEIRRNAWYYILEDGGAPDDAWDWRDYASAYGPFSSFDLAHDHLRENHANPGGHWERALQAGEETLLTDRDKTLARLIAEATDPATEKRSQSMFRLY